MVGVKIWGFNRLDLLRFNIEGSEVLARKCLNQVIEAEAFSWR